MRWLDYSYMIRIHVSLAAKHLQTSWYAYVWSLPVVVLVLILKSKMRWPHVIGCVTVSSIEESIQCRASIWPVPSSSQYKLLVAWVCIDTTCPTTVTCKFTVRQSDCKEIDERLPGQVQFHLASIPRPNAPVLHSGAGRQSLVVRSALSRISILHSRLAEH